MSAPYEFEPSVRAIRAAAHKLKAQPDPKGDDLKLAIAQYLDSVEKHDKLHIGFAQVRDRLVWRCRDWLKEPASATLDAICELADELKPVAP